MKYIKPATIALVLFFAFSYLFVSDNSFDQDFGRHLKLGEIILQNKQIPTTNLFSYTYPDFKFLNHHYLFEVLSYIGYQNIGGVGLLAIKVTLILTAIILTLLTPKNPSHLLFLPVSFIMVHVLRERTEFRPEILSFLFTSLTYFILTRFELHKSSRLIYALPLIQFLWTNSHIYFPIGYLLQIIFLSSFFLQKRMAQFKLLLAILFISILASLVNPNHINGLLYPLAIFNNYGYTIAENQNLFLLENINFKNNNFLFVKASVVLVIVSILIAFIKKTLTIKNLLIGFLGMVLALIHVRSFPFLIFLSLPTVLENFGHQTVKKWHLPVFMVFTIILLVESIYYLSGDYYKLSDKDKTPGLIFSESVKGAMDFVLTYNLPQPIFNNFDIGSYIIYRGFPGYRVFVDGRPEAYPIEFFQKVYIPIQENPQMFKLLDEKVGFKTIIFSHTDQTPWGKTFLKWISRDPGWETVYIDDFMVVLVRTEVAKEYDLPRVNLEGLIPDNYQFSNNLSYTRLSLHLLNSEATAAAKLFAQKSLQLNPQSPVTNLIILSLLTKEQVLPNIIQIKSLEKNSHDYIWW